MTGVGHHYCASGVVLLEAVVYQYVGPVAVKRQTEGFAVRVAKKVVVVVEMEDKKATTFMWVYCVGMSALMLVTGILF